MPYVIIWTYLIVSVTHIVSKMTSSGELDRFTQPLLMPLLIFYVYRESIGKTTLRVLLLGFALLLFWLGDLALIYQSNALYLKIRVGLFFAAQVIYIVVLRKSTFGTPSINILAIIPYVLYGILLFYLLLPLGDFTLPILVYGIVLMVMAFSAFSRQYYTTDESFQFAFWGSILFVLSDSILAVNTFHSALPYADLFVMLTYLPAQLVLTLGILKHID